MQIVHTITEIDWNKCSCDKAAIFNFLSANNVGHPKISSFVTALWCVFIQPALFAKLGYSLSIEYFDSIKVWLFQRVKRIIKWGTQII